MFFKHPLFWKEWKIAKWWSALIGSIFLVMFLAMGNYLNYRLSEIPEMEMGFAPTIQPVFLKAFDNNFGMVALFLLPVIIMMSIMLFQSDRKESVGMFISSLPFTKKEQFRVKWFTGVLAVTIPFLVATFILVLMRQVNIGWITQWYNKVGYDGLLAYDGVWIVLSILAQSYFFTVTFFSVLMLMQSLIANNIAASIIGSLVVAAPWFILEAGGATLSRIFNNYNLRLDTRGWTSLYFFMRFNGGRTIQDIKLDQVQGAALGYDRIYIDPLILMDHYIIKTVILIVIAVIAFYVGIKSYEKNDNSRNRYLLMFPWVGKVLVPGVTVCSGLLGNNIINTFFRIESTSFEIATLAISALIGYLVISKMIGLSEKHGV